METDSEIDLETEKEKATDLHLVIDLETLKDST